MEEARPSCKKYEHQAVKTGSAAPESGEEAMGQVIGRWMAPIGGIPENAIGRGQKR